MSNEVAVKSSHQNQGGNTPSQELSIPLQYENLLRFKEVKRADGCLWKWSDTHWQVEEYDDSLSKASSWLRNRYPDKYQESVIKGLVNTCLIGLDGLDEQAENIIPTLGGYLQVEQVENQYQVVMREPDPTLNIRYCINAKMADDEDWLNPNRSEFLKFLETILPDPEVRSLVQEYIGYTLLPDTRYQVAQFWLGDGANGKGTLMKIVEALHQNVVSADLSSLTGFGMEQIIGASLILVDEASKGNVNDQILKSLISGDKVTVNRKFRPVASVNCKAKFIIAGNHIPKGLDKSYGFWRRFQVVNFGVKIPSDQRDGMLAKRIVKSELGIVLRWATDGLVRLLTRGKFSEPAAVAEAKMKAERSSSSVLMHMDDLGCISSSTVWTPKQRIYDDYADWCRRNGMNPENSDGFWKQVKRECQKQGIDPKETQRRVDGIPKRGVYLEMKPVELEQKSLDPKVIELNKMPWLNGMKLIPADPADCPFEMEVA